MFFTHHRRLDGRIQQRTWLAPDALMAGIIMPKRLGRPWRSATDPLRLAEATIGRAFRSVTISDQQVPSRAEALALLLVSPGWHAEMTPC